MKNTIIFLLAVFSFTACNENNKEVQKLAKTPPMGWNSWDSYALKLNEETALANIDAFAEKLKPSGYEYFVIDAGWYDQENKEANNNSWEINIDEYGLLQASETYFPNGLELVIEHCHNLGIKFGLHLMRGIPRVVVKKNLPVKGTKYTANDIADTNSICEWSTLNYGIDMNKPGAQEYYNNLINQMAGWGVDFIKYDDIVPFPDEVEAVVKAIEQCGRPILLSLSPGDVVDVNAIGTFRKANMLRVTQDIWDNQISIDKTFEAMRKWQGTKTDHFWIDMDMIPFGQLRLTSPEILEEAERIEFETYGMGGPNRWTKLSKDQMCTFITQRAISASPLMMGGDLVSIDDFSLELLTNKEMIQCNQNGIMAKLVHENDSIEVWETAQKKTTNQWVAIFNRNDKDVEIHLTPELLKIENTKSIHNIWTNAKLQLNNEYTIAANGVLFLKIEI